MTRGKLILLIGCVVGVLALMIPLANSLTIGLVDTKGLKANPKGTHTAEYLKNIRPRYVFYRIKADEKTVHITDNFFRKIIDYQEQVVWHPDGHRFFFEVAGRRLYGYDVVEKRDLTAEEVFAIPSTTFGQTGYDGILLQDPNAPVPVELPWLKKTQPITNLLPKAVSPVSPPKNDLKEHFDFPPEN